MSKYWSVPRTWVDQVCFIIAGGPSVTGEDVEQLRGRHVIAINSSYTAAPFADYLFFGDARWWLEYGDKLGTFAGNIVTAADEVDDERLLHLRKVKPPPALSIDTSSVAMNRTSLQGAINFAVHLGSKRVVLLGADMRPAKEGRRTHHHDPYPEKWRIGPGCWDVQMAQLKMMMVPLRNLGVDVINTSMNSRINWWPKVPLADVIAGVAA